MIHFPASPPDAVTITVQCPTCLGSGGKFDPKGAGGRDYPLGHDWSECPSCEGAGVLTEEEADAVPESRRAE